VQEGPEAGTAVRAFCDPRSLPVLGSGHRRNSSRVAEVLVAEREFVAQTDEIELVFRRLTKAVRSLGVPVGTVNARSHYVLRALRATAADQR